MEHVLRGECQWKEDDKYRQAVLGLKNVVKVSREVVPNRAGRGEEVQGSKRCTPSRQQFSEEVTDGTESAKDEWCYWAVPTCVGWPESGS